MVAPKRFICFSVGIFAGALASFFPRLVAVLSGSPTDDVELFSRTYLFAGAIVAVVVGVVVTILNYDAAKPLSDVFMTALGVPALLMGALSTNAATQDTAFDRGKIKALADQLAAQAGIEVRQPAPPAPRSSAGAWTPLDLIVSNAHAQTIGGAGVARSQLGISAREREYTTVFKEAAREDDLRALRAALESRGIATRTVSLGEGRIGLTAGSAKPYSSAVLDGVRARELGAAPYLLAK